MINSLYREPSRCLFALLTAKSQLPGHRLSADQYCGPGQRARPGVGGLVAMTQVWITITGREVTQRRRNAVVTVRSGPNAIARTIAKGGTKNGFSEMILCFLSR